MHTIRTTSAEWRISLWLVVAILVALLFLTFVSQLGGATPAREEPPEPAVFVTCPYDGVFYAGPSYGAAPYVSVGSQVEPATIVGTVEGMRTWSVPAGVKGTITQVLVQDSTMVYMGQPLFKVELPAAPVTSVQSIYRIKWRILP